LAGITERQLLVSPRTNKASGFSISKTLSMPIITFPIVPAAPPPDWALLKK